MDYHGEKGSPDGAFDSCGYIKLSIKGALIENKKRSTVVNTIRLCKTSKGVLKNDKEE